MNLTQQQSSPLETDAEFWRAIDGDRTLRLDYDLDSASIVFDLGGYQGEWSEQICQRYGCRILVFEPVHEFADQIAERFRDRGNVSVFNFALGASNGTLRLALSSNATSSYGAANGKVVEADVRDFVEFIDEQKISNVDLLKINIEGGEFELLNHLISTGCIARVRHVQVQFHGFVPAASELRESIRRQLLKTHVPTYSLDWIWESWTRTADLAERESIFERGLSWHQHALRKMSVFAGGYAARNRELKALNSRLAEDSRVLNKWRRRLGIVLWIRNSFRLWG